MSLSKLKTLALVLVPIMVGLTACGENKVTLPSSEDGLVSAKVTRGDNEPIWPNDDPSIPDGKGVYASQNCAACHGADGKPVAGKATVDFSNKTWARKQKPLNQYEFITSGVKSTAGEELDTNIENHGPVVSNHPLVKDKLKNSDIWNLVFYVRSLATPPLTDEEIGVIDPVFGANCAVCHGKKGYGNGPLMKGNVLQPLPANFQSFPRFYDRDDDTLWDHIANGIKWEGMPNFLGKEDKRNKAKFDEEYIWKLVGYVRHFHESNKTEVATHEAGLKDKAEAASAPGESKPQEMK
jgi:mono/diheme cytochrome c family protein